MAIKTCTGCRAPLDGSMFSKSRRTKDGLRQRCKACVADAFQVRQDKLRAMGIHSLICNACGETKELRFFSKGHGQCKSCQAQARKEWRAANRDRAIELERAQYMRSAKAQQAQRYNTTPEHIDSLIQDQRGLCALCENPRKLVVDHCHETGLIRGMLCRNCNSSLGAFGDSVEGLERAICYLKRFSGRLRRVA